MTFNSNRVSNANTSTNADYQVANDAIGTGVDAIRYQRVKLTDGTEGSEAAIGTAANPLHVQGSAVGGDVNLAEVGGVAVTLGQKAEAASIPVVLATEQDTADTDSLPGSTLGTFTKIGVPWYDTGGSSEGWKPWPVIGDGQGTSKPTMVAYGVDAGTGNPAQLTVSTTAPNAGASLIGTRSLAYGIDSGLTTRVLAVDTGGVLAVQDNGGSLTVDDGGSSLTVDGTVAVSANADDTTTTFPDSLTAVADTVAVTLGNRKYVDLQVSGTYGNINIAFETSTDNILWRSMQMVRADSNTVEIASGALTNTTRTWRGNAGAALYFRARAQTWSSGSMDVRITNSRNSAEPVPATQTHAVTGSGTFAATQSGTWTVRNQDGVGNALSSNIVPPAITDRGLIVRPIGVYGGVSTATTRSIAPQLPYGYYKRANRTSNTSSTTTVIQVTVDPTTDCNRGDILRVASGTIAQGYLQWGVVASVTSTTVVLDTQTPLGLSITNGLSLEIWKPGFLSVDVSNRLVTVSDVTGSIVGTTPSATNKTFFEYGEMDFSSLTNTLASVVTVSNTGYIVVVANTTDKAIAYSIDGGSTKGHLGPNDNVTWNFADIGGNIDGGTDFQAMYTGAAPTLGYVSFLMGYY